MLDFYKGKKILVTGHTGFKGSWLSRILIKYGASVYGLSLTPETDSIMSSKYTHFIESANCFLK